MAHALTDHETIRRWAEARGARPASVKRTSGPADAGNVISLEMPGASNAADLEPISWHEWFRQFDHHELALLIENANRQPSNFNKLVKRSSVGLEAVPLR